MICTRTLGFAVMSFLSLVSCGGASGGSTPAPIQTPPPIVTRSFTFPAGDAVASKGTAWDIIGLKTTLSGSGNNPLGNSYDTLRVDVSFSQDVFSAVPAPGLALNAGNQIGVAVALDTSSNGSIGTDAPCNPNFAHIKPFHISSDPGNAPSRLLDGNYSLISNGRTIYSGPSDPANEAVFGVNVNVISLNFNLNTAGVFAGNRVPRIGVNAQAFNGIDFLPTDCIPLARNSIYEVFTSD